MKIIVENFKPQTMDIYHKFEKQSGSDNIGGLMAIQNLIEICHKINPQRILEMGGGIGALSYTLLKYSQAKVDIYEQNNFCIARLKENLAEFKGRYNIIRDYRILPPHRNYDLMIVDGGAGKGQDKGFFQAVWHYLSYIQSIKIVYIEGFRRLQRIWTRKALRRKYVYKITNYDNIIYKGQNLHGGSKIECRPSESRILRLINFLFWEIAEGTTIRYFFSYRLKRIKKLFNLK